MIFIAIVLAGSGVSNTRCPEQILEVAPAQLEVFLDPSAETRGRVLKRLRERIRKTESCDPVRDGELKRHLRFIEDGPLWWDEFDEDLPAAKAAQLLREARSVCRDPKALDTSENPARGRCSVRHLSSLVEAGDPLARPLLTGLTDHEALKSESLLWLDLVERHHGDRRRYLAAALEGTPPVANYGGLGQWSFSPSYVYPLPYVLRRAVHSLVGRSDPRTWDPNDVALLVKKARDLDRLIGTEEAMLRATGLDERGRSTRIIMIRGDPARTQNQKSLQLCMSSLARMGLQRSLDLVQLKSPPHVGEHFPLEVQLYQAEWRAAHPNGTLSPAARSEWERRAKEAGGALPRDAVILDSDMWEYVSRRARETNDAAPHPDLDAVQRALEALEREDKPMR